MAFGIIVGGSWLMKFCFALTYVLFMLSAVWEYVALRQVSPEKRRIPWDLLLCVFFFMLLGCTFIPALWTVLGQSLPPGTLPYASNGLLYRFKLAQDNWTVAGPIIGEAAGVQVVVILLGLLYHKQAGFAREGQAAAPAPSPQNVPNTRALAQATDEMLQAPAFQRGTMAGRAMT